MTDPEAELLGLFLLTLGDSRTDLFGDPRVPYALELAVST